MSFLTRIAMIAINAGIDPTFVDQFELECGDEELSEIQTEVYRKNNEVLNFARTLTNIQGSNTTAPTESTASPAPSQTASVSTPAAATSQFYVPSENGFQNGGYVVVDPNFKVLVSPNSSTVATTRPPATPTVRHNAPQRTAAPWIRPQVSKGTVAINTPARPSRNIYPSTPHILKTIQIKQPTQPVVDLTDDSPGEMNLSPEELPQVVPTSTANSGRKDNPQEKTYPSLVVTARTSLCNKAFTQAVMNAERLILDNKIRKVLSMTPSMFTEHLLQQRLLKCEQYCSVHTGNKLKLGMYSDAARFPYTGGYVWIADCCPTSFTSLFRGSIFEIGPHPPSVILKLIYHWACQTSVTNVLQWVKVDNNFLKTFYTYLRGVCIAAVHEKSALFGGRSIKIEVGVISLGTSMGSGGVREVKVDILGVMDYETKKLRLLALDHINTNETRASEIYTKKFQRIMDTLKKWVHPMSTVICDFAVDKEVSTRYGFSNIVQNSGSFSNAHIMDYLRYCVPRMFQNTLNLLSRHIIQQFLDELVWRETWGQIPSLAYDSIIEHLAEQTKMEGPEDLSMRYTLIASNPQKDWRYTKWPSHMSLANLVVGDKSATSRRMATTRKKTAPIKPPVPSTSTALPEPPTTAGGLPDLELAKIALEPYYYGTIPGEPSLQKSTGLFGASLTECTICSKDLYSSSAFTNHLIQHALNDNENFNSSNSLRLVCKFCMKPILMLEAHVKEYHNQSHLTKNTMCKICNTTHKDAQALIIHMTYTHCELDMPYYCEVCHYRTSIYQDMLVHFDKFHNKDTCVQCPFCLKVVRFANSTGEEMPRNQLYFVQHIQKHTLNRHVRKCEKCVLTFTNLATLRNHQENFHKSCTESEGVERYDLNPNDFILMAAPLMDPVPPLSVTDYDKVHTFNGKPLTPSIKIHPHLKVHLCIECDGPIYENHFFLKMTCTKCTYQTCCANAIKAHNSTFHQSNTHILNRAPQIGGRPIVSKPLYCTGCLLSTSNGDIMAAHLAKCGDGDHCAVNDKRKASSFMNLDLVDELGPSKRKRSVL